MRVVITDKQFPAVVVDDLNNLTAAEIFAFARAHDAVDVGEKYVWAWVQYPNQKAPIPSRLEDIQRYLQSHNLTSR